MNVIFASKIDNFKKIEKLIELHIKLTIDNPQSMALITGEWVHLNEPELNAYSKMRQDYEIKFKKILEACKKEGSIKSEIDTDLALFTILSSLHWLYNWYHRHKKINVIELEEQLKVCLLLGLKS